MSERIPTLPFFSFSGDFIIFYIGASHSRNPQDKQFDFIKEKWSKFLKYAKKPCAVVEGHVRKLPETETDAITQGGEISFVTFLANNAKVPVFCFEPPRNEEMNWLGQHFSKEEVEYYYFGRAIAQWHRLNQKKNIEEYTLTYLDRDRKMSGWNDFEFSIDHMKEIHRSLFQSELNFGDIDFFQKIENPTREDNPLKNVVRASSKYRDLAIVDGIKNLIKQKYNVFIVYGKGHTETYRNELEKYLGYPAQKERVTP